MLALLIGTASLGCRQDPISQAQRSCTDAIRAWSITQVHSQVYAGLSPGCIADLAEPVGLLVDGPLEQDSAAAYVLTGLLALLADDSRTVGDDQRSPSLPQLGLSQHQRAAELFELGPDAPAGSAWFAYVAAVTEGVAFLSATEMDGAQMRYRASENTIFVGEDLPGWSQAFGADLPFQVGGLLVHEATHAGAPAHIDCTWNDDLGQCDADEEGAYGVELWMLQAWMQASPSLLNHRDCEGLEAFGQGACKRINSPPDWPICTGERVCQ